MSNELAKRKEATEKFLTAVKSREQTFASLLPKGMDTNWFLGEVKVALARTPKLLECDNLSVFDALTTCAQLGLSPSGRLGSAYLIPFNGKCQLVVGYKGLVDLAYRSGDVVGFGAQVVYEEDDFSYSEGFGLTIHQHVRSEEANPGPLRYVYAWAQMRGGYTVSVLMLKREVDAIKARAPGARKSGGPWDTDPAEMWKKTALRRLIKLLPLSPQKASGLHKAVDVEDAEWEDAFAAEEAEKAPAKGTARLKELAAASKGETLDYALQEPPEGVTLPTMEPGSNG